MKLEKINPSVKAAVVMLSAILLSFSYVVSLNLIIFLGCLISLVLFSDARPKSIGKILIPAFIAAFGLFMMGLWYARGNSVTDMDLGSVSAVPYAVRAAMSQNLRTALQLSTRLLAFAGLGIFFALSTKGEEFIFSLMHQCRLSPKFAYSILAAVNLMPHMVREFSLVRSAFAVRGIPSGFLSVKPLFTMLVNSIRWSSAVAMAMESKGFSGDRGRTFYKIPRLHWYDAVFAVVLLGGIVLGMIFLKY